MRNAIRAVLALLLLGSLAAACGGDDGGGNATPASSTAASGAASSSSVDLGSGGGEFCDKARTQLAGALDGTNPAIQQILLGLANPATAEEGRKKAREYFEQLRKDNQELVEDAPAEIRETMQTALTATESIFAVLEAADYDFSKLDIAKITALTSDPKFAEASTKLEAYFKDKCGFDLGGSATTKAG